MTAHPKNDSLFSPTNMNSTLDHIDYDDRGRVASKRMRELISNQMVDKSDFSKPIYTQSKEKVGHFSTNESEESPPQIEEGIIQKVIEQNSEPYRSETFIFDSEQGRQAPKQVIVNDAEVRFEPIEKEVDEEIIEKPKTIMDSLVQLRPHQPKRI